VDTGRLQDGILTYIYSLYLSGLRTLFLFFMLITALIEGESSSYGWLLNWS